MRIPEPGTRVAFADANATVSDGVEGVSEGMVNGQHLEAHGRTYVPVWADRDNGREATTIWVDLDNLLGEEKK